jgi:phage regulator Rha-like protein
MELTPSNKITMSTFEISKLTGKQHNNVKRDCSKMLRELNLEGAQFLAPFKMESGQNTEVYNLDKRLTEILVTGYSIKLRAAVIDRLHELEAKETQPQKLKYEENYSSDPVIAIRQVQLSIIDNQKKLNNRLEAIENSQNLIAGPANPRELRKDKPRIGYENKGDVAINVAKITQTSKAIVFAVLEAYSADIKKCTYLVECTDAADNVIQTTPTCYFTSDVINAVKHAVKNSEEKTECFRVFKTLNNKAMKLKVK